MKKILLSLVFCLAVMNAQAQWQSLFNGKNLKGWKISGGTAEYYVEDGAITGVSTEVDNRNTFLYTEREYGDFILEFLFRIDDDFTYFNSGVQFRSHFRDNGRMYGYQYEIDPTSRAWTGGIYDEARLGWLYPLTVNPEAQAAFRHGDWNKARIEAVGNRIRTWINGVPAADVLDAQDASGCIALQVHAVYDNESVGKRISWKDIRIMTEGLEYEVSPETGIVQKNCIPNTISEKEAAEGWTLLWDGQTTNGWRGAKLDAFPEKGWTIENGVLKVLKGNGGESTNGGDIVTTRQYENFILSVDFKITDGANSGIKYFINSNGSVGCEYQILDDENHPDAKMGFNGNRRLGSLYDLIPAQGWQYVDKYGWNTARIVVRGNNVEHWINGHKILEYERGNMMWDTIVSHSKFARVKGFAADSEGYILLQDHNDEVHYRNLKIRILD